MIKYGKMIAAGVLSLGLAGCGTSSQSGTEEKPKEEKTEEAASNGTGAETEVKEEAKKEEVKEDTKQKQQAKEPETNQKPEQPSKDSSAGNTMRVMEQSLKFTVNGKVNQSTGFLKNSSNQKYSMYVLQVFQLTAEEPNKDIVFLKKDDSISMRIELLPVDANWEEQEGMAKAQLMSVSESISSPSLPGLDRQNTIAMEAAGGDEVVTALLIKDKETPVKITMFTKKGQDYRSPMLEMAKTISKSTAK
ncbi:hypothetical protein [Peribacillus sp. SCS-37]|uniref:hypothetical protein n=1 Tax=Paraperibacillus esterisolvens TaxID=3115296 RepID=UPI00390674A7